jgi:hypothetical protein
MVFITRHFSATYYKGKAVMLFTSSQIKTSYILNLDHVIVLKNVSHLQFPVFLLDHVSVVRSFI